MCNDYGLYTDYDDYLAAFSETRIPLKWPDAIPNLQPRDDIWPTDRAPVIRRLDDHTNEFSETDGTFPSLSRNARQSSSAGWVPAIVKSRLHK
jgi:putative SOS response-associated peptidase YedK